jgi:hypothetical protein
MLHRDGDLPAVIDKNKTEYWKNGRLHSDNNLPAVITSTGIALYYVNGLLHRDDDLPSIEKHDCKEWFRYGVPFRMNPMDPTKEFRFHKEWHDSNGNLHRDGDLPAYDMYPSANENTGIQKWYKHGKLHRIGAPAIISHYVHEYFENGKFIRSVKYKNPSPPQKQESKEKSLFDVNCVSQ